jgi:Holliday junction resolvase RusA-like endonuclease
VGDLDNYDKGPLDAMVQSGLFFEDDIQVVFLVSAKRYQRPNEQACVNILWFDFDM